MDDSLRQLQIEAGIRSDSLHQPVDMESARRGLDAFQQANGGRALAVLSRQIQGRHAKIAGD